MARSNSCLGIDIGSQTIRIAEVQLGGGKAQVRKLVEAKIDAGPGAPADRHGAIAAQIGAMVKANGFKSKKAVFCVPGQTAVIRTVKVPNTTPDKLDRIMNILAREQIPFPLDTINLEYQIFPGRDESELEGLLVGMRKEHVDVFMKLVRRTGLNPLAVTVSSLALHNFHELNQGPKDFDDRISGKKVAPKKLKKGETAPEPEDGFAGLSYEQIPCAVNLGASVMDLAIPKTAKTNIVGFTRTVPKAGNLIDQAIRQRLNLPGLEEAAQIKETRTAVLSSEFEISADATQFDMQACQAATQAMDQIAGEIRRSIEYFIAQPDGMSSDMLILSGGLVQLPYLDSYMEEKLGLPVERAAIKNEGITVADEDASKIASFVIPLGLAFQGLGIAQVKVDFLPDDVKNVRAFAENKIQLAAAVALLGFGIWTGMGAGQKYIKQYTAYADDVEAKKKASASETTKINDAESRNMEVFGKFYNLKTIKGEPSFWLDFSLIFLQARPGDMLIDQLDMFNNGVVRIVGRTPKKSSITDFKDSLERLKGAIIVNVSIDELPEPLADAALGTRVYPFTMRINTKSRLTRYRPIKKDPTAKGAATTAATPKPGPKPAVAGPKPLIPVLTPGALPPGE